MDFEPCYEFKAPNESVLLASNKPFKCRTKQGEANGQADIMLVFLPRPKINIDAELPASDVPILYSGISDDPQVWIRGQELKVILTKVNLSTTSSTCQMEFTPQSEPVHWTGDDNTKISKVVFHLFNYKDTRGTDRSVRELGQQKVTYPVTKMETAEWIIEVHNYNTSDCIKQLKETGGYGLTHIGCFYRADSSQFDGKTAMTMLEHLHHLFTFSKGSFCSPVLAVGFNDNEQKVWELLNSPREPWSNPISWFDSHHCDQLVNLFPGFIEKFEDKTWGDTLQKVLYWYARSADPSGSGIDTGIILTQIAIERLAYEYSVNHKKMLDAEDFQKLKASNKFRLLFSSLGIPMVISESQTEIHKVAKIFGYSDAPHALTDIRNSLVHPKKNRDKELKDVYYEAWALGLWYLELAILSICNYHGTCFNRLSGELWVGNVENVPWLSDKSEV